MSMHAPSSHVNSDDPHVVSFSTRRSNGDDRHVSFRKYLRM
jgi:hypothetical protein